MKRNILRNLQSKEYLLPVCFTDEDYNNLTYNSAVLECLGNGGRISLDSITDKEGFYQIFIGNAIFTKEGEEAFVKLLKNLVSEEHNDSRYRSSTHYEYQMYFLRGEIQKKATEILRREFPVPQEEYNNNPIIPYLREDFIPSWDSCYYGCKYEYFYTHLFILDYQHFVNLYGENSQYAKGKRYKLYVSDSDDTMNEWFNNDVNVLLQAYDILTDPTIVLRDAMDLCGDILD